MINREGTKKLLKIIIISIGLIIIIGYAIFTSHSLVEGPEIIVDSPITGETIASSSIIVIGKAIRIKDITLNGKPLIIDEEGNFKETLLLHKGYNVSLLSAVDKFGRTTEYKLELVYQE